MHELEVRHGGFGCFVWAALVVLLLAGILFWSRNSIPRPGQVVLVHGEEVDKEVYIGPTEADGREIKVLIQAHDDLGLRKLVTGGTVFALASGTRCRVLEHDWLQSLYRVRVLEGKETGKSGWVYGRFLSEPLK